ERTDQDVNLERYQLCRKPWCTLELSTGGAELADKVLALDMTQLAHALRESVIHPAAIFERSADEEPDAPNLGRLLRARRCRQRRSRAAQKRDEFTAPESHSTTSSAMASSVGGTSRRSALAVLRLMISASLVTCCTGRSPAFSPLRIRPT